MKLADEVRIVRKKAFLTQDEFAAKLSVASNTVNRWESGKSKPNITAMKKLVVFCKEHNIDSETLENSWVVEV